MLKRIKTTTVAGIAALGLTLTMGTTAQANTHNQFNASAQAQHKTVKSNSRNVNSRRSNNNDQVIGGVVGALAGGLIGSEVAGRNARTEGAVIGALVGGFAGASLADNNRRSSYNGGRYNRSYSNNRSYGYNRSYGTRYNQNRYSNNSYNRGYSRSRGFNSRRRSGFSRGKY